MTIEVAIIAAVLAISGWAYLHIVGRRFDQKYGDPKDQPASPESEAATR